MNLDPLVCMFRAEPPGPQGGGVHCEWHIIDSVEIEMFRDRHYEGGEVVTANS